MRNSTRTGALLAAALLLPLALQAQGGLLGRVRGEARGAAVNSIPITAQKEREIGREIAATVLGRWHAVNDSALTEYVSVVGSIVAQQSPRYGEVPFHFAVLDTDEINAFATPGGYIFVTRGALATMESEAELAGVLAHEIGPVDQKHVLAQIQRLNMMAGATSEALPSGPLLDELIGKLTSMLFMGVGREAELESDSIGQVYAARAGYRPDGMLTFVRRLIADTPARRGTLASMRATHPPASERVEALQRQFTAAGYDTNSGQALVERYRLYTRRR
jgi:predicted Zn-dependent protease